VPEALETHRLLGERARLRRRRPRGHELSAVELVQLPDGHDEASVSQAQQASEASGATGPYTVGLLVEQWSTRRLRPVELARRSRTGRPPSSLHEKVRVWNTYRLVGGRPVRCGSDHDRFDEALRRLLLAMR
jgi:hypothetical protein